MLSPFLWLAFSDTAMENRSSSGISASYAMHNIPLHFICTFFSFFYFETKAKWSLSDASLIFWLCNIELALEPSKHCFSGILVRFESSSAGMRVHALTWIRGAWSLATSLAGISGMSTVVPRPPKFVMGGCHGYGPLMDIRSAFCSISMHNGRRWWFVLRHGICGIWLIRLQQVCQVRCRIARPSRCWRWASWQARRQISCCWKIH